MLKLSSQQFAFVYEGLRAAGKSGGSERREHTRMDVQARVKLATFTNHRIGRSFTGLTRDISATGVGLFQFVPAENGVQFLISFPADKEDLLLICTSRFCRAMAEGVFGIGAEFDAIAPPALLEQFNAAEASTENRIRNSILG